MKHVNWSKSVFRVKKVNRHRGTTSATTYTLVDKAGVYYRHQLQPIPDDLISGKSLPSKAKKTKDKVKSKVIGLKEEQGKHL